MFGKPTTTNKKNGHGPKSKSSSDDETPIGLLARQQAIKRLAAREHLPNDASSNDDDDDKPLSLGLNHKAVKKLDGRDKLPDDDKPIKKSQVKCQATKRPVPKEEPAYDPAYLACLEAHGFTRDMLAQAEWTASWRDEI
jgi:hypothetical protein